MSAIILPIALSLFAEIVATSSNLALLIGLDITDKIPTMSLVYDTKCFSTSVRLCSGVINVLPALTNASVNTIDVVVPSPAVVAVLSAASFIIFTARFSIGSSSSTALATVTPSLVTVIPCV